MRQRNLPSTPDTGTTTDSTLFDDTMFADRGVLALDLIYVEKFWDTLRKTVQRVGSNIGGLIYNGCCTCKRTTVKAKYKVDSRIGI